MAKAKRIISLFLSVLLVVTMLPASVTTVRAEEKSPAASGTLNEAISYTFDAATGTLTLTGTGKTPVYGYRSDYSPFKDCTTVKHIVVEEGITGIDNYVFYHMTGLESVRLPATVTVLYSDWFRDSLIYGEGFTVAEENPKFCAADGILFNKDQTELVRFVDKSEADYENYTIPDTVKTIRHQAFVDDVTLDTLTLAGDQLELASYAIWNAAVKHLRIQEGVKDLGSYSSVTGLEDTELLLPASLEKFDQQGLLNNNMLQNITVASGNPVYYDISGVVVRREDAAIVKYPNGRQDASYTTPTGVKGIVSYAMMNDYLTELTLSEEIEKVGSAFAGGAALKTLTVKSPFVEMPDDSDLFWRMSGLKKLYAYEHSTIKKYLDEKCSSMSGCFTALPDCTAHQVALERRVWPTCTEDGIDVCGVCGTTFTSTALQKLGHDYQAQVIKPSCASEGYTVNECSRCDSSYISDMTPKTSEHLLVDGCRYNAVTQNEERDCKYKAGAELQIAGRLPETEHPYLNRTDETYCITYKGAKRIKIVFDELSETESSSDPVKFYKDSIAPENLLDIRSGDLKNLELTFDTDTLVMHFTSDNSVTKYGFKVAAAYGIFDGCGYMETTPHTKHTEIVESDTASTCQVQGETVYKCTVCEAVRSIPKALVDHNYEETGRTAGDCQTQGTVTLECSYCRDRKVENTGLGAHDFKKGICRICHETHTIGEFSKITVDAEAKLSWNVVENALSYDIYFCDAADPEADYALIAEGITDTEFDLKPFVAPEKTYYVILSARADAYHLRRSSAAPGELGYGFTYQPHQHSYSRTVTKQPTCTSVGEVTYTCVAGDNSYTEKLPVLGHTHKAYATKASLTSDGKMGTQCSVCKAVLEEKIIPKVSAFTISKSAFVYNGKEQKPVITVRDRAGAVLKNGIDYTVSYSNGSKNTGIYSAVVTLKGSYEGSKSFQYRISPKKISIAKLTAAKKGFQVSWKKQNAQVSGCEIQYSTDRRFKKSVKTLVIKKNKTTSKSISKLKAKKKYYVRIRTYKMSGKTKLTSAWSKAKAVTTKK